MNQNDWQPEAPIFTRTVDREIGVDIITVERWPRQIEMAIGTLANMDASVVNHDGDTLTFIVANGQAAYTVIEHDYMRDCLLAVLESCRLSKP